MRSYRIVALLLNCVLAAQESRPATQPAAGPRREGGFLGLYFTETPWLGRRALAVQSVHPGSDAERVGFLAGDRIVAVNGRRIDGGDEFIKTLWGASQQRRRGRDAITVLRDGKELTIAAGLHELDAHPAVGDPAPDFTLKSADGKREWALKEHLGNKPVVLVFGSFT
jgi:membrane-associated protease RseP (regulator of RpoE activity)